MRRRVSRGHRLAGGLGPVATKVLRPSERNGHHPAVFFRSTAFGKLISRSGEPADLVLIDTPALLGVSEAVTIADHADAVLLVVNRGTSLADLRRARERLAFTETPLIGYLLNRGSAQRGYTPATAPAGARMPAARCAAGARETVQDRHTPTDLRRASAPRHRLGTGTRRWLGFVSPPSWRSTTAGPDADLPGLPHAASCCQVARSTYSS